MFNEEFFPTPKDIIRKMIAPYYNKLGELTILEPSAGKGDILDYIQSTYSTHRGKVKSYCIERNKELQYILSEKGYKIISEDFLNYTGDYYFDLILMNPPFSNGDAHLLKAWDVLFEGDICCLLNAETLKNPYSEKRKLLQVIIAENGSVEYLGNCFRNAERPTGVEVAMVRLTKKAAEGKLNFKFEKVTSEDEININEETLKNPIATRDVVGNMILQFNKLKDNYVEYLKIQEALSFYSQGLFTVNSGVQKTITETQEELERELYHNEKLPLKKVSYNIFCDKVKNEIWKVVIDKMGMERYMTHNVRQNFSKFIETQGAMDFTKENVANLIRTLLLNGKSILENAITDVFDIFTKYYKENRCYIEGWKTNDKWKVNRRIILPDFVESQWGGYYQKNFRRWSEYSDIEKVLCFISGKTYEDFDKPIKTYEYNVNDKDKEFVMESLSRAISKVRVGDSSRNESEFFYFRCYKKGTLHIEFKDKWLWEEFNLRACSGKNWLPESEKKKWEDDNNKEKITALAS